MKATTTTLLLFSYFLSIAQESNTTAPDGGGVYTMDHPTECISAQEYEHISRVGQENATKYIPATTERSTQAVTYSWPLKAAASLTDCNYYFISAHVDQDTLATTYKDYNCGTIAYDGHRGTDIAIWPFPFYKMDNNQVEIIAAEPGTIVNKQDGNFDKNCASNNLAANYLVLQHADGSWTIYYHMKKNSLTSKAIGQTVVAGEFLGNVGSSGSSTGPHLHFEVWAGSTVSTRQDPFSGTCNYLNGTTRWTSQKPYTEPAVLAATVGKLAAVFPTCPATETPNSDSCLTAGTGVFSIYMRNEVASTTVNLRIINPNNTTFSSWTYNCAGAFAGSYRYWNRPLPSTTGTYTFETSYNGVICSKQFKINCGQTGVAELDNYTASRVYPNPSNGKFVIEIGNNIPIQQGTIEIYNTTGALVYQSEFTPTSGDIYRQEINLNAPAGFYFYKINGNKQFVSSGKLAIE